MLRYVALTLELRTALHIGAGRAGMIASARPFVPGHVLAYALTNVLGAARGGQKADFAGALEDVLAGLRCGPLFVVDPQTGRGLLPAREREAVEALCFTARNQVALHGDSRSAVDGALYEIEAIDARCHAPSGRPQPTRLRGGLWTQVEQIDGRPLRDWLGQVRLGGELTRGFGRVQLIDWQPGASDYAGRASAGDDGLHLATGDFLPGPALAGADAAPLLPWLGRRFCPERGPGRRFDAAALVRMDARATATGCYLPAATEPALGCWVPA